MASGFWEALRSRVSSSSMDSESSSASSVGSECPVSSDSLPLESWSSSDCSAGDSSGLSSNGSSSSTSSLRLTFFGGSEVLGSGSAGAAWVGVTIFSVTADGFVSEGATEVTASTEAVDSEAWVGMMCLNRSCQPSQLGMSHITHGCLQKPCTGGSPLECGMLKEVLTYCVQRRCRIQHESDEEDGGNCNEEVAPFGL